MNAAPASIPPSTPSSAAALRRILLLPGRRRLARGSLLLRSRGRRRGRLLPRGGLLRRRCLLDAAQRGLEVVKDEPDRRIGTRRRGDRSVALAHDEDAALPRRNLELRQWALTRPDVLCRNEELLGSSRQRVCAYGVPDRGPGDLALVVEDDGGPDLRRDLGQVGECLLGIHGPSV